MRYLRVGRSTWCHGLIDKSSADGINAKIRVTESLEEATANADFVCESIIEDLDVKKDVIRQAQTHGKKTAIIASNTSTLLPTSLQEGAIDPGRILVAHFWNPAHLVPLVEVCGGKDTDPKAIEVTEALLRRVGKDPVVMKREILGFIGNRIMHAMYREALSLVSKGIVDADGADRVVLSSFGPRFANLGPLEYFDYIGLDHIKRIQRYLYDDLDAAGGVSEEIDRLYNEGKLGTKTGSGLYDWAGKDADDVRIRRDIEFIRRLERESGSTGK